MHLSLFLFVQAPHIQLLSYTEFLSVQDLPDKKTAEKCGDVYKRQEETKNGDEFSKELASLCDVFVNDAFGTAHRAHCSNVGVTQYVDTAVISYDFCQNSSSAPYG